MSQQTLPDAILAPSPSFGEKVENASKIMCCFYFVSFFFGLWIIANRLRFKIKLRRAGSGEVRAHVTNAVDPGSTPVGDPFCMSHLPSLLPYRSIHCQIKVSTQKKKKIIYIEIKKVLLLKCYVEAHQWTGCTFCFDSTCFVWLPVSSRQLFLQQSGQGHSKTEQYQKLSKLGFKFQKAQFYFPAFTKSRTMCFHKTHLAVCLFFPHLWC